MKQESIKKPKKLLWLWIGLAVLVLIAGAVGGAVLLLGGEKGPTGPVGGRPDLYWNLDKEIYTKDSETGLSTREAAEDGMFHIRFAYNGEQVELAVADKQLVNFIDTMDVMGLVKDSNGVVVDVVSAEEIATPLAQGAYVQQIADGKIIANSSMAMNGMQYTLALTDLTQIYDVSDTAEVAGQFVDATDIQVMDTIWVFANDKEEITHIYMTDHSVTSRVYWRALQMWDFAESTTSRVPDENGVYHIDFCVDGEIVTLKCKDRSIVVSIDNKSPHSCHFGFVFDEEGYIVEIINSGIGIRGAVAAERIEVLELDGNYFSGMQQITSDSGLSYSATLPEDCVIYDASSAARTEGRQGQQVDSLKLGDRVCVWTDTMGTPVLVYIANRLVDCDVYYNLVRYYDGTKKETLREVDWAGYYTFEMVKVGDTNKKTLKTKDKEIATFIDSQSSYILGLKTENGIIKYAYDEGDVYGWSSVLDGYIPQIQGTIVSMVSFSRPDTPTNVMMKAGYKAYDMTGKDVPYGTETTLRVGDRATIGRDVACNGLVAFITHRLVDGDNNAYYNLDYQYNSSTKETNRKPDADGYYVFTMAHKGKQVTVKTKDKELASRIDQSPVGDLVCIMRVNNAGIVQELYPTNWAYGQVLRSGYRVKSVNADGTYTVYYSSAGKKYEYTLKMAEDCIMYNVGPVYSSHKGERCYSLKPGDMVTSLANYRGEVKLVYVRNRAVDNIYVNKQPMYDTANKVTLRKPDANGYYWFDLAVDGELKKFKTNDIKLASQVDAYNSPFGLQVKGDEILRVTAATYAGRARTTPINGWDVTSVSKWSLGVQFNKVGYGNTGEKKSINLSSNVKVFDISPTAKQFGEKVELKKGDRILVYGDLEENAVYIYVLFHDSRVKGSFGYCEHCKKEVKWLPWAGGSWDGYDAHYYLAGNVQYSGQSNIGNSTKHYEIVLDLNGCKYSAVGSRALLVRYDDTLSIIDSVGGGSLSGTGVDGGNGGTFLVSGGNLNLYSGTLSFIDSEDAEVKNGAVIYANGTNSVINMYGGTITGGIVNSPDKNVLGGNMHLQGVTFNMYGGVVENGQAIRPDITPAVAAQAGNIYAGGNAVINLYEGSTIRNGYSNQHGGNVFISTATLNLLGGKVYGGECLYAGGNINNQFGAVLNTYSGTIENGTAGTSGNNIYVWGETGEVHLNGGTITGDIVMSVVKSISVSGDVIITKGQVCGLTVPSSVKLTVGELKNGAEIFVSAKGAFSEPTAKAQSYVDAGYIKSAAARSNVVVEDNVLAIRGEVSYCEHCGEDVEWNVWTGTNLPASGHYFVDKDFKQPGQLVIKADTDVVIDLYGHKYSSTKIRNFLVRGTLSIMDSVGGGEMVVTGGKEFYGSIAMVGNEAGSQKPAGFNLYSGTLRLDTEHPDYELFNHGGLIIFSGGELNVYGGTMIGGRVRGNGGCIYISDPESVLNIMGGTITGGTADADGDCIYVAKGLNMVGGTVTGEVYVASGEAYLAGSPVIEELNLPKGTLVDISYLESNADIGIRANGVFTTEMESAADYLQYVHSVDPYKDIVPVNNALTCNLGKAYFDKYNGIHTLAEKMTDDGVFSQGGTVTAYCPVCENNAEWVDLGTISGGAIRSDGHYYLSRDLNIAGQYEFYADACLHLNGHNITSPARALYVDATTSRIYTLNVMGEGVVTGAGLANATVPKGTFDIGGSVNFFGGTYVATGANPTMTVRGYYGRSVVNVYDGAEFIGKSANMFISSQAINVYGGKFTGGTTKFNNANTNALNIYGGTFTNNGQIVYASGEKNIFNIAGGTFEGTVVVAEDLGTFTVSGAPIISNLDLTSGKLAIIQNLTDDAKIAVNANGAFTGPFDQASAYLEAGYIVPANSGVTVYEENGVLYGAVQKIYCAHCEQEVEWKPWGGYTNPVSGHYYIDGDYTQTAQISIVSNTDVVLDLRGNIYSSTKIRNFLVNGKLSVVDTAGDGKMISTGGKEFGGSIALVGGEGSQFNLYSGTLELDVNNAAFENFAMGGLVWLTTGEMNVYDGTMIGGYVTDSGGCVRVEKAEATLNIYGGTITGGTAAVRGGCIDMINGVLNIAGGTVDGEVYVSSTTTSATLSGSAKIAKLVVADGALVDIGGLTNGAQIAVDANGVFTKPLTNAKDYLDYFSNKDYITVENDALVIKNPIELANSVHSVAEKMTADGVFAAGGTVTAVCPVCGTEERWIDITTVSSISAISAGGHYYLSKDVQNTTYYGFYANACLHLNGHNITSSERAIYVDATTSTLWTLNIMGEGVITGAGLDNASVPRGTVDIGGSVNFYGGTYVASGNNPAVTARGYLGRSAVNIYDGSEFSAPNVSLLINSVAVNMYGGKVVAGTVKVDKLYSNEFNVYGGTIGNVNEGQDSINASGSLATLYIGGGVITEKVSIAANLKKVTVSGAPVVANLDLTSGKKLLVDNLEPGADICIAANNAFTDALTNADAVVGYFDAVDPMMDVTVVNNALVVCESVMAKGNKVHELAEKMTADGVFSAGGDVVALCPVCNAEVTWRDLNALTSPAVRYSPASGHYYLSADMQRTARIDVAGASNKVCLHLNGHNITNTAERVLYVEYASVNIMGEGVVTGSHIDQNSPHFASTLDASGNLNLYGGVYKSNTASPVISSRSNKDNVVSMYAGTSVVRDAAVPGLNIQVIDQGDFVMYGGLISGGTGNGTNGGNVFVRARNAAFTTTFTIYGGVIENGVADIGGNIYAAGTTAVVNIFGGEIKNGDVFAETGIKTLKISGRPVVSELNLISGKKLTVGQLKNGADITVFAEGVFTEATGFAERYTAFFKAASDKKVIAQGGALAVISG